MASDAPNDTEKELKQWKLIADFRTRLEAQCPERTGSPAPGRKRRLEQFEYLSLFLLALVNPTIKRIFEEFRG